MFRGSFARFAAAFSLFAGTLAVASPSASAQLTTQKNSLYVTASGGGWAYALADSFDTNSDRVLDYKFYFYHYRFGTFTGTYSNNLQLDVFRSRYDITSGSVATRTVPTVTHDGVITNQPGLRFTTTCKFTGGGYGYGSFSLIIYQDVAGTGGVANRYDKDIDRVIINGAASSINGAIVSFASTFNLNPLDPAINSQDLITFEQRLPRATIGGWYHAADFPQADFNGDGRIDGQDYDALKAVCNSRPN